MRFALEFTNSNAMPPSSGAACEPHVDEKIYLTEEELVERWRGAVSPGTLRNWRSLASRKAGAASPPHSLITPTADANDPNILCLACGYWRD